MKDKVQFYQFTSDNGPKLKKDQWLTNIGISRSGEIFVPLVLYGNNENKALLCANHDGVSTVRYLDHIFVPITWIEIERKNDIEVMNCLANIRRNMKDVRFEED